VFLCCVELYVFMLMLDYNERVLVLRLFGYLVVWNVDSGWILLTELRIGSYILCCLDLVLRVVTSVMLRMSRSYFFFLRLDLSECCSGL